MTKSAYNKIENGNGNASKRQQPDHRTDNSLPEICLSFNNQFCGLPISKKSTEIGIQRIIINPKYKKRSGMIANMTNVHKRPKWHRH